MTFYFGVVEDRDSDSLMLTRYKVRVVGVHSPLLSDIETSDLPWATPVQNNSAAISGIGSTANGYLQGSTVIVVFADENKQIPLIIGAIAGIPNGTEITGLERFASMMSNQPTSSIPPKNIDPVTKEPLMMELLAEKSNLGLVL